MESDKIRSKYQHLQEFLYRNMNGWSLPVENSYVSANASVIVTTYAAI